MTQHPNPATAQAAEDYRFFHAHPRLNLQTEAASAILALAAATNRAAQTPADPLPEIITLRVALRRLVDAAQEICAGVQTHEKLQECITDAANLLE